MDMTAAGAAAGGGHDDSGATAALRHPREHELITRYLRPKIASEPLPPFATIIHEVDICSAPPSELTARYAPAPTSPGTTTCWYFFSPMHCHGRGRSGQRYLRARYRVGKSGLWVPCVKVKVKADGGGGGSGSVGFKRWFDYVIMGAPVPRKKEWRMVEYMVPEEEEAADGEQQLALFVVSRARRRPARSEVAQPSSSSE